MLSKMLPDTDRFKMVRIATAAVAAAMVDMMLCWYRSDEQFIAEAVRGYSRASTGYAALPIAELPIAKGIDAACPFPAAILRVVQATQKAVNDLVHGGPFVHRNMFDLSATLSFRRKSSCPD